MAEDRTSVPEEKFEDYSSEQLEVKKRITEEKIQERIEFSIPYRIQKRFGIDIYRIAKYLLVIEIIILIVGIVIIFAPVIMNPTIAENPDEYQGNITRLMIFLYPMIFVIMPTSMIVFGDPVSNLRRKLKEINRAIRIKQEVYQGGKFELVDESETREYKSTFKYDLITKKPNTQLSKAVVQSILGFLNSEGGHLVIGVSDSKEVLGIDNDLKLFNNSWDKYQLGIQDAIRDYTDAPLSEFVKVKRIEKDDKSLCSIITNRSPKPVYYMEDDKQDLYIRDGNRTRKLPTKQAYVYINQHWFG